MAGRLLATWIPEVVRTSIPGMPHDNSTDDLMSVYLMLSTNTYRKVLGARSILGEEAVLCGQLARLFCTWTLASCVEVTNEMKLSSDAVGHRIIPQDRSQAMHSEMRRFEIDESVSCNNSAQRVDPKSLDTDCPSF